jgi:SAM-dependent methyltransferase
MPQAPLLDDPWFARAFDRFWLRLYAHRDDAEAARQAPAIARLLALRTADAVLDVACGGGRHARALARLGYRVTGVDLSRELLDVARERSPYLPGKPDYFRCDMRRMPFVRQFRGAFSMFTSFGYFDCRADDVAVFAGARRALVPGGRFLLDYLNAPQVRATLVPEETVDDGTLRVFSRRRIADGPEGPCVFKRVEATDVRTGHRQAAFEERVRLYSADEVDGLLEEAGLEPVGERLGDVHGAPHDDVAPRLVRVAVRQ